MRMVMGCIVIVTVCVFDVLILIGLELGPRTFFLTLVSTLLCATSTETARREKLVFNSYPTSQCTFIPIWWL
jgi:hypothetical protein